MKRNNMNKVIKLGLFSLMVSVVGSSCIKSLTTGTDFSSLQPTVLIPEGGSAGTNFSAAALLFPPTDAVDTAHFFVNYASTTTAPQDEVITIGIDDAALAAYNALGGAQYAKFPDSIYSFTATSATIPKGANYSSAVPLAMYPDKIDLTQNYMLPISVKSAPTGATIAANYTTVYFHLIGNPIAGLYNQEWIRYNTQTQTPPPAYDQFFTGVFAPIDGSTISVNSGTGVTYILSFTDVGGVFSNWQLSFDPASVTNAGITITGGPTIVLADPVAGKYSFNFTYLNSAGHARNITDNFIKQ